MLFTFCLYFIKKKYNIIIDFHTKREKLKKLVAYITTGFPSLAFTEDIAFTLAENGADMLELGIPFSDPVADGPIIEQANLLSLKQGFKLDDLFNVSKKIGPNIPTFWMGYFNSFYHKGFEYFISQANEAKLQGFIIPDLPFEESLSYKSKMEQSSLDLISFVAPTDSPKRISLITKDASGFVYLVAYAGITGANTHESLDATISSIRESTSTPIFVGFGVDANTAKEKANGVDGVIVGSAFVKILLDSTLASTQKITNIGRLAREIKDKINP